MDTGLSAAAVFDPHSSALLHNEILRRGWDNATHSLDLSFDESTATWWETYGLECNATGVDSRLAPELIDFLQSARIIQPQLQTQVDPLYANLFYYLASIALPEGLFRSTVDVEEPDPNRYVLLYYAADVMSHPLGLVFDQHTLKAQVALSLTIDDTIVGRNQRPWIPLQDILAGYMEMIDLGKVVAEDDYSDSEEDEDLGEDFEPQYRRRNRPWLLVSHSEAILERTVMAFDSLLKAIEARMPQTATSTAGTAGTDLAMDTTCGMAQVAEKLVATKQVSGNNFIVKFLRKIDRRIASAQASLKFIAPGLRIPGDDLVDQLFEGIDYHTSSNNNPILLLRGEWSDATTPLTTFPGGVWNPFPSPYTQPSSGFPSGLWIAENEFESPAFDDTCRLLLPDRFLANIPHHAKSTDGFLLEQPRDQGEGLSAGLFQTSCNIFLVRHEVQLFRVLEHWVRMVEDGTWTVDEYGVAGGMEKWAEADEDGNMAEKYRLPYTW